MDFFNFVQKSIGNMVIFLNSFSFVIFLALIVIFYHIISHFFRDRKYIEALNKYKDPETVTLKELKEIPLVNIIIPAWKEGRLFEDCLMSITKLNYPKLKVIVNAGGNDETIKIANSFTNYKNFLILEQKPGGKIKALNECMKYISEGIIYSIDADVILTDEILLRLIYPIINENEFVTSGGVKPLNFQQNKSFVKYIQIDRNYYFKHKFSRYIRPQISGPNTCFKYEVIKKIEKFTEEDLFLQTDRFRGPLILSKGFKIYWLNHYRSLLPTFYPDTLKKYFQQENRWRKNLLFNPLGKNKKSTILKFIILIFYSIIIILIPLFVILNYYIFVLICLVLLLHRYLIKMRKFVFFKITMDKTVYKKFGVLFFIKLFFYLYLDAIITLYLVPSSLSSLFTRKKIPLK